MTDLQYTMIAEAVLLRSCALPDDSFVCTAADAATCECNTTMLHDIAVCLCDLGACTLDNLDGHKCKLDKCKEDLEANRRADGRISHNVPAPVTSIRYKPHAQVLVTSISDKHEL